ncbi:MAG: hypothetical protein CVV18_02785 [Gammaproteobacteria bacterium HGW-Gammaproteobacteria-8]|nr:MAG: hypothetical protein CVV18_02785 [Gammaproteobacteria bacterium HGW-Gammaproteobacteria-8]
MFASRRPHSLALLALPLALLLLFVPILACAEPDPLIELQQRWAEINYETPENQRREAFGELAEQADQLVAANPEDARLLTWQGIIYSTWAGTGGLKALGRAKAARRAFERAIEIDEQILAGSAHTSLGVLYHEVPGWPIGFGDQNLARQHLERGLALNPDGIDSNYFFGKFLLDRKHLAEAGVRLRHALEAPDRPGRELADRGRREEVRQALQTLEQKLAARRR